MLGQQDVYIRQQCPFSWFGPDVNPPKTWLFVRDEHLQVAHDQFGSTGINITTEGRPVLGLPCGQEEYFRSFCSSKVEQWLSKVSKLARFAKTQPDAAHAAFTHSLSSKPGTYLSRYVQSLEELLQPLEDVICRDLLPSLTGQAVSDLQRRLLSLSAHLREKAMCNQVHEARPPFDQASAVIAPIGCTTFEVFRETAHGRPWLAVSITQVVLGRKRREAALQEKANGIRSTASSMPSVSVPCTSLAQEKGAPIWLTAVPMDEHAFALSRGHSVTRFG